MTKFWSTRYNSVHLASQMMAPALVGKLEGVEGTRRIAAQEAEDTMRRKRRMEMRQACAHHSISVGNAMAQQSKVEKKAHKKQVCQMKDLLGMRALDWLFNLLVEFEFCTCRCRRAKRSIGR
jgi:hypothetical protein